MTALWEALAAGAVGLAVLWLVLQPALARVPPRAAPYEPPDPEETPEGLALGALKEIEFDRATGKLSDEDFLRLQRQYTAEALAALRNDTPATLAFCSACGAPTLPAARFCSACGAAVAPPPGGRTAPT